jgi:MFS family permease
VHEADCASLCNESWAVVIAAGAGFAIVLLTAMLHSDVRTAVQHRLELGNRKPFSFTATWASNFTVAGAILGPILSANASSSNPPPFMSWHSYQLLSILFGAVIVLAPFAYLGRVLSFLVGTALTLAAVVGQAGAAGVIMYALGRDAAHHGNSVFVSYLLVAVVTVGAFCICVYVWRGIPHTVDAYTKYHKDLDKARDQRQVPTEKELADLLGEHDLLHSRLADALPRHEHFRLTEPGVPLPA